MASATQPVTEQTKASEAKLAESKDWKRLVEIADSGDQSDAALEEVVKLVFGPEAVLAED